MKRAYPIIILPALSAILLASCSGADSPQSEENTPEQAAPTVSLENGFQIFQANCVNCHSPQAGLENGVAPPMNAVKHHYLRAYQDSAKFVSGLTRFLALPDAKSARMKRAVEKYGPMPGMGLNEEEMRNVAAYIYVSTLEQKDWHSTQFLLDKQQYGGTEGLSPLEKGKIMALQTKSMLGSHLKKALSTKGTEGALSFCSLRALPLTDSMSVVLNARIQRVSDRNRNPKNAATGEALEYIKQARIDQSQGRELKPKLIEKDGKTLGFYPILTEEMCLQCHGTPNTRIKPGTMELLKSAYPNDKATGFHIGDLRGIWVVEMSR